MIFRIQFSVYNFGNYVILQDMGCKACIQSIIRIKIRVEKSHG